MPPLIPKISRSKISNAEWGFVIGGLLFIDIVQAVLSFFLIGIAVNRLLDIFIGGFFLLYLQIRGELSYQPTRNRVIAAFLATFIAEELPVPFLDIAVFWSLDGYYCWRLSKERNRQADIRDKQRNEQAKQLQLQRQQERELRKMQMRENLAVR